MKEAALIKAAMAALGRKTSPAKAMASRANGRKGGRPVKKPKKVLD